MTEKIVTIYTTDGEIHHLPYHELVIRGERNSHNMRIRVKDGRGGELLFFATHIKYPGGNV